MQQLTTIELFKEDMKFSSGHFTIFSSSERENIHGHNYRVYASFTLKTSKDGMSVDYRFYKEKMRSLCKMLDEIVIIPGLSKYLDITETEKHFQILFNSESMNFLKRDILVLPITNVTVEELAKWFIQQITSDRVYFGNDSIIAIKVKIFSGPGQSGSASWKRKKIKLD
jgi:6-pyruvoyltetrahydropterin/6-carboxytetrahydropterin synthase